MAKHNGETVAWVDNPNKRWWMYLWLLLATIAGIVMASYIAPIIAGHLILLLVGFKAANFIAFLAAIALVLAVVRFLSLNAFFSDLKAHYNKNPKPKQPVSSSVKLLDTWYFLAHLAGLGVGIALALFIAPLIVEGLMVSGITNGFAIFISILAVITLLQMTVELFLLPNLIYTHYLKTRTLYTKLQEKGHLGLALFVMAGALAGIGLGIYLSMLVFKPIVIGLATTVLAAAMPHALAVMTAVIVSVGLVAACYSLFSRAASLLAVGIHTLVTEPAKGKTDSDDDTELLSGTGSKLEQTVKAASIDPVVATLLNHGLAKDYEDGAAFTKVVATRLGLPAA